MGGLQSRVMIWFVGDAPLGSNMVGGEGIGRGVWIRAGGILLGLGIWGYLPRYVGLY
jgi:hypothetical protein